MHNYLIVNQIAFIALDSKQLGEDVDDKFHYDFGDNQFPYFLGNQSISAQTYSTSDSSSDDDEEKNTIDNLNVSKYIQKSLTTYCTT